MTRVALVRHFPTAWNREGLMQGRADVPITSEDHLRGRTLIAELKRRIWYMSPLLRARETAIALGVDLAVTDERLIEMNWGAYEGKTLADLRSRHGTAFTTNEASGLDFQPKGGESPREVQARLREFFADIDRGAADAVAITHKGVIRAALCLATNWDMRGKPPIRLDWSSAHDFLVEPSGSISLEEPNRSLFITRPK